MFLVRVTGWFFSVEDPDVRGPRLSKMVRFHGQHLSQLAFLVPGTNCECISMLRRIDRVRSISSDRSRHPSLMNSRPATCCPKLRHVGPLSFSPFPRFLHVTPPSVTTPKPSQNPGRFPAPCRHATAAPRRQTGGRILPHRLNGGLGGDGWPRDLRPHCRPATATPRTRPRVSDGGGDGGVSGRAAVPVLATPWRHDMALMSG